MKERKFCQSCSMPLDDGSMRGTEKDGSPSDDYCKYCYQNGAFTAPGMSLDEMKKTVQSEMEKRNIDKNVIVLAVKTLPYLDRWKKASAK